MSTPAAPLMEVSGPRRALRNLLTEQLRVLLEHRSIRLIAVGTMLVVASLFALVEVPIGVDTGWLFILPVAVTAIAAGLREGLLVAFISSVLFTLYSSVSHDTIDPNVLASVLAARFALYGITAAVLGAFAEAHYSVQSHLRQLATIDPLTKVSNVARFYHEASLLEAAEERYAVLLVDLDGLKKLNDEHGHQVGSAAIQTVANVLKRVVRASDCVARYGGDEFVVILKEADRVGAQIVINRLRIMLIEDAIPGGPDVELSVSIGVAIAGEDGQTAEELLKAADEAMYADKRSGRSAVTV